MGVARTSDFELHDMPIPASSDMRKRIIAVSLAISIGLVCIIMAEGEEEAPSETPAASSPAPFVPSKQIPVDQVVDFPVDI